MPCVTSDVRVPFTTKLLRGDLRALAERKNNTKRATTIGTRISFGDTLRVRRPVEKVWSPATCVRFTGPRNFLVKTDDAVCRHNRRDLLSTRETPVTDQPN